MSAPGDYDNGEISGMIDRGNRSTRRKPAPVPLCPPQTPHAVRTQTRAAVVGNQRLTAELRHGPVHVSLSYGTFPSLNRSSGYCVYRHRAVLCIIVAMTSVDVLHVSNLNVQGI
jgi:hypothetical protein